MSFIHKGNGAYLDLLQASSNDGLYYPFLSSVSAVAKGVSIKKYIFDKSNSSILLNVQSLSYSIILS